MSKAPGENDQLYRLATWVQTRCGTIDQRNSLLVKRASLGNDKAGCVAGPHGLITEPLTTATLIFVNLQPKQMMVDSGRAQGIKAVSAVKVRS